MDLIARHGAWAGPILGLLTFGESLALIGAFVPATALMVAAGALAAAGILSLASVLVWCCAGAILGEAVSYALGRGVGPTVWRHRLLRPQRRNVARARLQFRRHGVAVIFLDRFMGPVQAVVPVVAGAMRMPGRRFHLANVVSAMVWAPLMLAPGYLAGGGLKAVLANPSILEGAVASIVLVIGCASVAEALIDRRREQVRRPA